MKEETDMTLLRVFFVVVVLFVSFSLCYSTVFGSQRSMEYIIRDLNGIVFSNERLILRDYYWKHV